MNNAQAFKLAHIEVKKIHKAGESYQVTFGACLKLVKAQAKAAAGVTAQSAVQPKGVMTWVESHNLEDFAFGATLSIILSPFFAVMLTAAVYAIAAVVGIDPSFKGVWAFLCGFVAVSGVVVSYVESKEGHYQYGHAL